METTETIENPLTPLERARLARLASQSPGAPRIVEPNPIRRFRAKPTRSLAIHAMCAHCMGCTDDSIEPGFRRLIRECGSTGCPLYGFRPYQSKDADDDEDADQIDVASPAGAEAETV